MKVSKLYYLLLITLLFAACGKKTKKSYDELGDSGSTTRTENLQTNLRTLMSQGVLIGHRYATLEGVGWANDTVGRSDIQSISGDFPACSAYELAGIEHDWSMNRDSVSFRAIRDDALNLFKRGGLVLMQWSAPDYHGDEQQLDQWIERVAHYLSTLQNPYGIKAPVVLFLYPQAAHAWYTRLSDADYQQLYETTAGKLNDLDVTNVVYGYSCGSTVLARGISNRLPKQATVLNVEVILSRAENTVVYPLRKSVEMLKKTAAEHNLIPGLTTGVEGIPDSTYFSTTLLPLVQQRGLSYVVFGRNHGEASQGYYTVPYPGCGNEKVNDFMKFYNDATTLFLKELNGLYLKKQV